MYRYRFNWYIFFLSSMYMYEVWLCPSGWIDISVCKLDVYVWVSIYLRTVWMMFACLMEIYMCAGLFYSYAFSFIKRIVDSFVRNGTL